MIDVTFEKTIRLPAKAWREVDEECEKTRQAYIEAHMTTCKHCGYMWIYKGKLQRVTCPSCQLKTVSLWKSSRATQNES